MQLIKGGFSHRIRTERPNLLIWQRGFTDRRIRNSEELVGFRNYIHENPVKAGLCAAAADFPYSSAHDGFALDLPPTYLSG